SSRTMARSLKHRPSASRSWVLSASKNADTGPLSAIVMLPPASPLRRIAAPWPAERLVAHLQARRVGCLGVRASAVAELILAVGRRLIDVGDLFVTPKPAAAGSSAQACGRCPELAP